MPVFNSDRMMERGYDVPGRVTLPITDETAHATYYLACLNSEKKKYTSLFNAVRAFVIRETGK